MRDARKYTVYPSNLDIMASFQKLRDYLSKMNIIEDQKSYGCTLFGYSVTLPGDRRLRTYNFSEFLDFLKDFCNPLSISTHSHWKTKTAAVSIDIDINGSGIDVAVEGELTTILAVHEIIRDVFKASMSEPKKSPSLSRYNVKKSVFLAHRFDEEGNRTAKTINTFLMRLGFDVLKGEGYETRDIPGKVADRIKSQDIFILLATSGDSSWIISEAAYAKALNKYIIILIQDNLNLKKGIIGTDHEHISFPNGHVEKTFNDLLYALPQ
jgi:hypothetical protein